jgi:hypothetical protein
MKWRRVIAVPICIGEVCVPLARRTTCGLGGYAAVDTFFECATRWIGCELSLVLSEELLVPLCETLDLVYVLHAIVRSVAGNLPSRMREHSSEHLVVSLLILRMLDAI